MYECNRCGLRFEKYVVAEEKHGLGYPPYEKIAACPHCHGTFEELEKCEICGEWHTQDEITNGVCDKCIYSFDSDIEFCYTLGNEEESTECVSINGFIASVLTNEQINEILIKELRIAFSIGAFNCNDFIDGDKSWFADKIKEAKNDRAGIQTASGNKPLRAFQD